MGGACSSAAIDGPRRRAAVVPLDDAVELPCKILHEYHCVQSALSLKKHCSQALARSRTEWKLECAWRELLAMPSEKREKNLPQKMVKMAAQGIPVDIRGALWMQLTGAYGLLLNQSGVYDALTKTAREKIPALDQIEKDINRTYPSHPLFHAGDGEQMLWRVLVACAVRSPELGYVQGLNFIAGVLLLVLEDEEKAFWVLQALFVHMDRYPFYLDGLEKLQASMSLLGECITVKLPKLAAHLGKENVMPFCFASPWFLTFYAYNLPIYLVARVWDLVFTQAFLAGDYASSLCMDMWLPAPLPPVLPPPQVATMHHMQVSQEEHTEDIGNNSPGIMFQTLSTRRIDRPVRISATDPAVKAVMKMEEHKKEEETKEEKQESSLLFLELSNKADESTMRFAIAYIEHVETALLRSSFAQATNILKTIELDHRSMTDVLQRGLRLNMTRIQEKVYQQRRADRKS